MHGSEKNHLCTLISDLPTEFSGSPGSRVTGSVLSTLVIAHQCFRRETLLSGVASLAYYHSKACLKSASFLRTASLSVLNASMDLTGARI